MLSRRLRLAILVSVSFLTIYILLNSDALFTPSGHTVTIQSRHDFLPEQGARSLCAAYDLKPFPDRSRPRKIYDLLPISTELDWLEIRMHELDRMVDYFVIVESTETFTGTQKPLFFKENYSNFTQFSHKVLYHALDLSHLRDNSTWEREAYSRNALYTSIFPSLLPPAAPNKNDVLLVSDTDEIPRPEVLTMLRNCEFPDRVTLRSRFYYYSFQWRHIGDDWHHPQATFYAGPNETILPEDLRMHGGMDIWNSSWHCSSCFSTVAELVSKIKSFSHTEYDKPEFCEPREIVRRVRNGIDLFDRESEKYEKTPVTDVPNYLKQNQPKFAFLLDRDPANGNFKDYSP